MNEDEAELAAALGAHGGGPQWQAIAVGDRVQHIGGRRQGVVTAIVQRARTTGITTHVAVRWQHPPGSAGVWPTDFLIIIGKQEETA